MRIDEHIYQIQSELESLRHEFGLRHCKKETGVSISTLSRFLNGKDITLDNFEKISKAMDALYERPEGAMTT